MMFRGSRGGGCAVTYLAGWADNGVSGTHPHQMSKFTQLGICVIQFGNCEFPIYRCRNSSNLGFTSSSLGIEIFRYTSTGAACSQISPLEVQFAYVILGDVARLPTLAGFLLGPAILLTPVPHAAGAESPRRHWVVVPNTPGSPLKRRLGSAMATGRRARSLRRRSASAILAVAIEAGICRPRASTC